MIKRHHCQLTSPYNLSLFLDLLMVYKKKKKEGTACSRCGPSFFSSSSSSGFSFHLQHAWQGGGWRWRWRWREGCEGAQEKFGKCPWKERAGEEMVQFWGRSRGAEDGSSWGWSFFPGWRLLGSLRWRWWWSAFIRFILLLLRLVPVSDLVMLFKKNKKNVKSSIFGPKVS